MTNLKRDGIGCRGRQFEPYLLRLRLHDSESRDGGALQGVVWPGMLFPNSHGRGYEIASANTPLYLFARRAGLCGPAAQTRRADRGASPGNSSRWPKRTRTGCPESVAPQVKKKGNKKGQTRVCQCPDEDLKPQGPESGPSGPVPAGSVPNSGEGAQTTQSSYVDSDSDSDSGSVLILIRRRRFLSQEFTVLWTRCGHRVQISVVSKGISASWRAF